MKIKSLVLLSSWFTVTTCFAQKPISMSIDSVLKSFYISIDSTYRNKKMALIYQENLLDSSNLGEFGIYYFAMMSSTSWPYLYIRNRTGEIRIIENYTIENCLKELLLFFDENQKYLSQKSKLNCTERVLNIIKRRQEKIDYLKKHNWIEW